MCKDLIMCNAMAIAQKAITNSWTDHVSVSLTDTRIEVTLYFDLHDEKAKSSYKWIKKNALIQPEYDKRKYDDDSFETIVMNWEFE